MGRLLLVWVALGVTLAVYDDSQGWKHLSPGVTEIGYTYVGITLIAVAVMLFRMLL